MHDILIAPTPVPFPKSPSHLITPWSFDQMIPTLVAIKEPKLQKEGGRELLPGGVPTS